MSWATGAMSRVIMDWETSFKTPHTGSAIAAIKLPFTSFEMADQSKPQKTTILGSGRTVSAPFYGNRNFTGTLKGYCDSIGFGYILRMLFGPPTTTGSANPYTHTFKISTTVATPSFVLEKGLAEIPYYYLYKGCKANGFSLSLTQDGKFEFTVTLLAASETGSATSYQAVPTTDVSRPAIVFDAQDLTITEGGSSITTLDSLTFNYANNPVVGFGLGGNGEASVAGEGAPSIDGTIRGMFNGDTILAKGRAKTESSLVATMTRDTASLVLAVDELFYNNNNPPLSGPGGVYFDLSYEGCYINAAAASAFRAVLTNSQASYA